MAANGVAELPPEAENELVAELARLALEQAAPEELVLFPDNAKEYFKDPQAALSPVVSSSELEWLTLDTVVNYDAKEVPLVTLAKAVEGRYPGRTAIRSALVDSRVTIQVENIRFAKLLEKVGLIVLEDRKCLQMGNGRGPWLDWRPLILRWTRLATRQGIYWL
jgi:hypothetical protein